MTAANQVAQPKAAAPDVRLTAFRVRHLDNWQDRVAAAATRTRGHAARRGTVCCLWDSPRPVAAGVTLRYAEGVRVSRLWLGSRHSAIAITPRRFYFEEGSDTPSPTPERDLVTPHLRPSAPSSRVATCLNWAERLASAMQGVDPEPLLGGRIRLALHLRTRLLFRGSAEAAPGQRVCTLLMKHGPAIAPPALKVPIITDSPADPRVACYQRELTNAFRRIKVPVTVTVTSIAALRARLEAIGSRQPSARDPYCFLLAVNGGKGKPLPPSALSLIASLQSRNIPFRMFSVDNPALNWSALDQVGSLLQGAGGSPYTIALPWPQYLTPPFILGVDLGHPKTLRESWVVISLMHPDGRLIASWRHRQPRDETVRPGVLAAGLHWAKCAARMHAVSRDAGFLVIRDGRLHQHEHYQAYARALDVPVTLVELAKYDNPELFIAGNTPQTVATGTECLPVGAATPFIAPVAPRMDSESPRNLKLHMNPAWDGLHLGPDAVAEIVTGLAYSPSLGLATHTLPGPIYWADGIAAIGESNHQFAGQRIVENHTAEPTC